MLMCDFNKVLKQLYWNPTLAWVFSCKFAAYFQDSICFCRSGSQQTNTLKTGLKISNAGTTIRIETVVSLLLIYSLHLLIITSSTSLHLNLCKVNNKNPVRMMMDPVNKYMFKINNKSVRKCPLIILNILSPLFWSVLCSTLNMFYLLELRPRRLRFLQVSKYSVLVIIQLLPVSITKNPDLKCFMVHCFLLRISL